MLNLFTQPSQLARVHRNFLIHLLDDHRDSLSPAAISLMEAPGPPLGHEEFCAAWAAQFKNAGAFGAPLRLALVAIETLALPENAALLDHALNRLPAAYEVNRNFPPFHQSLHLWLIAQNTPGVIFPIPLQDDQNQIQDPKPEPFEPSRSSDSQHICENCSPLPQGDGKGKGAPANSSLQPSPESPDQSKIENFSPALSGKSGDQNRSRPAASAEERGSKIDFSRLAALPPAEYDRLRKAEAKRLHLRLATLDDEVERCRELIDEAEAEKVFLPVPEPWPQPITDAPALFDAVHDRFTTYAWLPPGAAVVCTLFLGHVHAFPAFHYTPRINILSDKENSGKSTTVKIIAAMAPKPFRVQNLRPPVVYRVIDKRQPTIFLDEIETFLPLYRELLGLLNAGNSSDACVPRCEGRQVRVYKAFAPVVLAGIGDLFRTLRSRSILIHMTEAPEGVALARFNPANLELETTLARQLARWAADNLNSIAACDPPLPPGARNRVADNWRPLFQIAHIIGAHWPARALEAFQSSAVHQSSAVLRTAVSQTSGLPPAHTKPNPAPHATASHPVCCPESTVQIQNPQILPLPINHPQPLLTQILLLFSQAATDRLFSRDLVARLNASRPWSNPLDPALTERSLANRLRPLGIRPRTLWIGGTPGKGYLHKDFFDQKLTVNA